MPDVYLDTDTYNKAQGDLWERDQLNGLADRWASQAVATMPSRVADAQDRVTQQQQQEQAANQAAADQWEQQATAQYATPPEPESAAGVQGVGGDSQQGSTSAGSPSDSASPPAAQPPAPGTGMQTVAMNQPVPMGPMDTAAPVPSTTPPPNGAAPVSSGGSAQPASPNLSTATLQPGQSVYEQMARQAAQQNGLDPDIFVRQLNQESGLQPYNPDGTVKTSPAGARGVAQFMPDTAKGLGINPDDPQQAIPAAAQYMAGLVKQNGGDYSKALAAYNAGQGNVDKYGGVPPFAETQKYVSNILSGAGQAIGGAVQGAAQAVTTAVQNPQSILDKAKPFIGQNYVWGGKSPDQGFDCSGLAGYLTTGQPESTTSLYGKSAGTSDPQPGDLVFWNMGSSDPHMQHVAVYLGNGQIVQSGGDQSAVNIGSVNQQIGSAPEFRRLGPGGAPAQAVTAPPGAPSPADPTTASLPTPDTGQQPIGSQPRQERSMFDPLKQLGDTISGAITTGLQSLFGTSDQPNPIAQAITPNLTDPTRSMFGNNPVPTTQQPSTTGMAAQAAFGTPQQPRGPNEALTGAEQALGQNVVAPVLNTLFQPGGPIRDQRQGLADALTSATQGSPVPGVAGAGQYIGGMISAPTVLDSMQTVQDLSKKYAGPNGLPNLDAMTAQDRQTWDQATMAVAGVASPLKARGGTSRFFHGTGSDFARPDPGTFDPNGLYGPGYYMTDNPDVAGGVVARTGAEPILQGATAKPGDILAPGYATTRGATSDTLSLSDVDRITDVLSGVPNITPDLARQFANTWRRDYSADLAPQQMGGLLDALKVPQDQRTALIDRAFPGPAAGPNVRAIDVPGNLRLFNADAPVTPEVAHSIADQLPGQSAREFINSAIPAENTNPMMRGQLSGRGPATGDEVYRHLQELAPAGEANDILRRAGFDGIQYQGGVRTPMMDASGQPIQHNAVVVFPESLDKIRNAVSGRAGGQVDPRLATTLGGAAGGGLTAYQTTDPNDPNRLEKIGAGIAGGAVAGFGAGTLAGSRAPVAAAPLTQSANPLLQRTGQMLEAKPPAPATDSLVNRLVRATTNRFEAADRYQQDAINQVGLNPANPPQDLDLSAALRMQSSPAAEVRVQQGLAPAIQAVGEQDRNWLSAYLMHANNVDVASALGNPNRKFPGGFSVADSAQVLNDLPNELGPQRWQNVQDAAQQIYSFTGSLRQRMVDSGLISQQTASDWASEYPHWVPTRVLDYMDEAGGPKVGTKISLSDNGVRQYTEDGTARFAEDPLASLVGLAQQVESKAMKNEAANALVLLDQARGPGNQLLTKTDRPVQANETVIQRINNGTVERYVAPPQLAAVINGPAMTQAPAFVRAWTGFLRNVTTVLSPAFALVRNPSLDIPEYMTRELARSGGNVLELPHIIGELAKGYADAFKGFSPLTEGTFAGSGAQQFMLSGGGGSGLAGNTFANRADAVARLAQDGHVLGSTADVGRVLKDLVTLKPVARTAERTELGPRIASMRLAQQRGSTQARATLAGRTVTLDFNEGGTVAKTINQFVPFFNAGIQGSMAVPRMIGEHPTGAVASMMMTAGLPAVAAEAWNQSDPQRAKDYADVPDYLKQQGVVVMMPGDAPTDDRGNRRPQFWWINMRGMAPLSSIAREATGRVLQAAGNGNVQPEDWQHLIGDALFASSPIRANTVADVPGSLSPQFIPGADVGLQLMLNKDIFRGSDIVTPRKDQYASAVGKSIADGLTAVARLQNPAAQVHPSQVDFTLQQMLGGVGSSIMGASNIAAGQRADDAPQSAPVLGGLVKALGVRGDTGQELQDARAEVLQPEAQRVLNDVGLPVPLPQPGTIHWQGFGIPLHQDEQANYQQAYSQLSSQLILRYATQLRQLPNVLARQQLLSKINDIARTQAEQQILRTIPSAQITQRVRDENARQAAGIR